MSELSKNQLTTENNNSFPNNNTGYITPTLLRTFNQNMIDSLVDEQTYTTESGSFNARINALDPSGSAQALLALEQATASLNSYTQSQNSFNSSATASIVALQNFSSSLDTTFATDAQLSASVSALSASVTVTTNGLSSSIGVLDSEVNALQSWSSSLDSTYATDAQLSASASTLQDNINTLSSSVAVTTLGLSSSVAALQQFSSSLDSTFATDAQLSASASTLQNNINAKLDSSSFNSYTQSNDAKVNSLISATGSYATLTQLSASASTLQNNINGVSNQLNSYSSSTNMQLAQIQQRVSASATTGSNTFYGNQIVSGNINVAGNISAISASFLYIDTVYETASIIFSSGSNQLGDELTDVQTLSGSVKVQGGLFVNGVPVQTSSFDASGYLLTSSFNQYTESAASNTSASINSATQSLSQSIAVTTNGLDLEVNGKLDSGSFNAYTESNDTKVNALIAQTGSYAISSSVASAINSLSASVDLTYATKTELSASASILQNGINSKVEISTFNTYTSSQNSINQGLASAIATKLNTTTFNSYTSSNDSKVNSLIAATGSYITSAQTSSMTVLSASYSETASYALNTQNIDTGSLVTTASFNAYTESAALGVSESINSATQSLSSSIAVTTNNLDLEVNGKLDSSSFNSYTQSNDSVVNALVAATASYVTETESGSFVTGIVGTTPTPNGIEVTKGDGSTSTITIDNVTSASYSDLALTASYALNVVPTDVTPFLSQSTFNAYTQSNDSKVNALIDKTGSYATTGSNTFIGNQTISGSLLISGNITAISASFQYIETVYETASVIYSSGSNQFGDASNDTQTLFGRVDIKTGPLVITGSTFASGNITITQNSKLIAHDIEAANVSGIEINNSNGNAVALFGAGGSQGTTFYGQINTTAISSSGNITGNLIGTASFATTASFALNANVDSGSLLTTSSFNSYTASNDSKVNALIAATSSYAISSSVASITSASQGQIDSLISATSSYVTELETGSFATTGSNNFVGTETISGSLIVSGNFNAKVGFPALNVTNNIIQSTGSIVVSQDIVRQGGGPTDVASIRLQALSGSAMSGDTLQSTITAQNNLNTSTLMTGSTAVASISAVWATGSAGGRVAYTAGLTSTAQSGSAISVLSGNTIRLGTSVSNVISSTGSFGPMVLVGPLNEPVFAIRSGSFEVTTPQGSGSFYTNLPITSSNGRINGYLIAKNLIISGTGAQSPADTSGSVWVEGYVSASTLYAQNGIFGTLNGTSSYATQAGNAQTATSASYSITASFALNTQPIDLGYLVTTASFNAYTSSAATNVTASINSATSSLSASLTTTINGLSDKTGSYATTGSNTFKAVQIISSSVRGEVKVLTISSTTASMDCSLGNFFTLQLVSGAATNINPTNILPGQTINIRLNTTGSGTVTFPTSVKQQSGSAYTPTTTTGVDVITLVSFDTSSLYLANVKNLI